MKKSLFIVEAPGKTKKIKLMLNEIGIDDSLVVATKGRLFDLPKSELSINIHDFSITSLEPVDAKRVQFIKESIEKCEPIYIMTDEDIEGEVIAKEVSSLIPPGKESYRTSITNLTTEALKNSFSNLRPVNESIVSSGLARRIYDRFVGYVFNSQDWENQHLEPQGVIGRVLTPIISVFSTTKQESGVVYKKLFDKDKNEWDLKIPFNYSNKKEAMEIKEVIDSLPLICVKSIQSIVTNNEFKPWSGDETLLNISLELDKPVIDIAMAMQSLYEEGDISYPRSDSSFLSKESLISINKIAQHAGFLDFDKDVLLMKSNLSNGNKVQGAHEAVIPLTNRIDCRLPLISFELKDQVLLLITKNIIQAGRKDFLLLKESGKLDDESLFLNEWNNALLNHKDINFSITRSALFKKGSNRLEKRTHKTHPYDFDSKNRDLTLSVVQHYRIDWMVLKAMFINKIGRPSTMPYHAAKIASRYINEDGGINRYAQSSINRAKIYAPELLNPKKAALVESILHEQNNFSIKEKVMLAIKESGISNSSNKQQSKMNIKISEDIEPSFF
jgi:Topoisomerase IA